MNNLGAENSSFERSILISAVNLIQVKDKLGSLCDSVANLSSISQFLEHLNAFTLILSLSATDRSVWRSNCF